MTVTRAEVEHVARLARLRLSDAEIEQMARELSAILEYVARLDELDLEGVAPTFHAASGEEAVAQPLRADEPSPSLAQHDALENAPHHDGTHFVVPRVV